MVPLRQTETKRTISRERWSRSCENAAQSYCACRDLSDCRRSCRATCRSRSPSQSPRAGSMRLAGVARAGCPDLLQLAFREWKGHDKGCTFIIKPVTNPTTQAPGKIVRDPKVAHRPRSRHSRPVVRNRAMNEAAFPCQLNSLSCPLECRRSKRDAPRLLQALSRAAPVASNARFRAAKYPLK